MYIKGNCQTDIGFICEVSFQEEEEGNNDKAIMVYMPVYKTSSD